MRKLFQRQFQFDLKDIKLKPTLLERTHEYTKDLQHLSYQCKNPAAI